MLTGNQLDALAGGAWITVQVTLLSAAIGIVVSLVVGVGLLARPTVVRAAARSYTELFRGVAAIILVFWLFYTLPTLGGPRLSPMVAGGLALGGNMGAYGAEIVRGAMVALPRGQTEAGISLNLTAWQRLRHVLLPQALVGMLPPFGNLLIEVLKGTALLSLITLRDITFEAQNLRTNRVVTGAAATTTTIFLTVLVMYFVLAQVIALGVRWAERRASRGLDLAAGR